MTAARVCGGFTFGEQSLFNDVALELPTGRWTCLIGASGIGKSTILRLIAGLDTGGSFNGKLETSSAVAYMAQSDLLLPWLTLRQNVNLGKRQRNEEPDNSRVGQVLEAVGLLSHADKKPAQLSGGMRQRAALARTLLEDRPLVLLDEPFSALDAQTRHQVQALAYDMLRGRTVLLVTHDLLEAVRLADQLVELTPAGVRNHTLPDSAPPRDASNPAVIACQAGLLQASHRGGVSRRA